MASASASSSQELEDARDAIYSLEGLLEAARKELDEQKNEVAVVRSSLQETILHTHVRHFGRMQQRMYLNSQKKNSYNYLI